MPLTQSDKITLTNQPPLPSKCCVCNKDADGKTTFLDFQMSLDFYGAVVICGPCVAPVAQLFNLTDKADADEQLRVLHDRVTELQEENGRLQTALDAIISVRPDLGPDNSGTTDLASEDDSEDSGQPTLGLEI